MMDIIDGFTKILNLILMLFFLCAITNSIWSWLVSTIDDRQSISNNQVKSKNTQMD